MYPGASGNCCFKECKAFSSDGSCCTRDMPCGLHGGDCDGGDQYTREIKLKQSIFKMRSVLGIWNVAPIIVSQFGVRIHPVCGIAAFNNQIRVYDFGSINKIKILWIL